MTRIALCGVISLLGFVLPAPAYTRESNALDALRREAIAEVDAQQTLTQQMVDSIAMATPIAHKGSTAGAKVQALTELDFLLEAALVEQAWDYFTNVQTEEIKYEPLIAPLDRPAIEVDREKMEKFLPELRTFYFDPTKYDTYLEQLGIAYPTVRK